MDPIERMSTQYYNWGYVSADGYHELDALREWIWRYEKYNNVQYKERRFNPLLAEFEGIELQAFD